MTDTRDAPGPWSKVPALWAASGMLIIAVIAGLAGGWERSWLATLVRDPAAQYDYPTYVGLLSHLGVMAMTATTAIALFATVTLASGAVGRSLLLAAGTLSAILLFDDVFMLHEQASRLGEVAIFASYGIAALFIARGVRNLPGDWDLRGLKLAVGFMAASVLTDIFKIYGPFAHWLEDFTKLAGFGAWMAFWASFARAAINWR
ncbi:hypothetical protein N9W17_03785 [Jannaschia sp.]|nr:hypothetical protein [Jannaschia sp.]